MYFSIQLETLRAMHEAFENDNIKEMTVQEIRERLNAKSPNTPSTLQDVRNALSRLKAKNITMETGSTPRKGSRGGPVKLWALTQVINKLTEPESETENEMTTDITASEVISMNDRKPRQGTIEHDIMRLTKAADRMAEENEKMRSENDRVAKAIADHVNNGDETGQEIRAEFAVFRRELAGFRSVLAEVGRGVLEANGTTSDQLVESMKRFAEVIEALDQIGKVQADSFSEGFAKGWEACMKNIEERAERVKSEMIETIKNQKRFSEQSEEIEIPIPDNSKLAGVLQFLNGSNDSNDM